MSVIRSNTSRDHFVPSCILFNMVNKISYHRVYGEKRFFIVSPLWHVQSAALYIRITQIDFAERSKTGMYRFSIHLYRKHCYKIPKMTSHLYTYIYIYIIHIVYSTGLCVQKSATLSVRDPISTPREWDIYEKRRKKEKRTTLQCKTNNIYLCTFLDPLGIYCYVGFSRWVVTHISDSVYKIDTFKNVMS